MRDPLDPAEVEERLAAAAIPGMAVKEVASVPGRRVRTTWATYEITINPSPPGPCRPGGSACWSRRSVEIERARDPEGVTRDIRPGVGRLQSVNGRLVARLRIAQDQIVTSRDLALALEIEPATTIRTDIELVPVG